MSNTSLSALARDVTTPAYDRASVRPGIVHLGVGAFHRAHQAVMTDDCLNRGETDWGIVGVSLRSPATRNALAPQDHLYTLAVRDSQGERLRVIGALQGLLVAPEDPEAVLTALADPRIRVVTLTITEKGYTAAPGTGDLLADHPDVIADLRHNGSPRTALGIVTEALARRRSDGVAPFTLLSCDNISNNGKTLHRALTQFAEARDPELGRFVAAEVACPSTMVDRIVPATTDADRATISASLGLDDRWPIVSEPFFQWVVEDRFPTGRPHWERNGVEFVADVVPHEHMKLRLLNGAHTAIAAIGRIAGADTVSAAMADPAISAFIQALWREVIPTVDPGIDTAAYIGSLARRFQNAALPHATSQIASDASQKIPIRILDPMRDLLAAGSPTGTLVFAVAAWIRSCAGYDEQDSALPLNDPVFEAWTDKPDQSMHRPDVVARAYLGFNTVFDDAWRTDRNFQSDVGRALDDIATMGVRAASMKYAGEASAGQVRSPVPLPPPCA